MTWDFSFILIWCYIFLSRHYLSYVLQILISCIFIFTQFNQCIFCFSLLTYELHGTILLSFQVFEDVLDNFLLLISILTLFFVCVISIYKKDTVILLYVSWVLKKNICSVVERVLQIFIRSCWMMVLLSSSISFLILCLILSIVERGVFKFLTVTADMSVSPCSLSVFASHIL